MATYDENGVLRDCLASVSRPIEKAVHLNENLTRAQSKATKHLNKTKIRRINHLTKMEQNISKKLEAKAFLINTQNTHQSKIRWLLKKSNYKKRF